MLKENFTKTFIQVLLQVFISLKILLKIVRTYIYIGNEQNMRWLCGDKIV